MAAEDAERDVTATAKVESTSTLALALALAAVAAVGAGIGIQQILTRRLSKPELARLRFYRYLRERGHLES